jgi:hypothetical protein
VSHKHPALRQTRPERDETLSCGAREIHVDKRKRYLRRQVLIRERFVEPAFDERAGTHLTEPAEVLAHLLEPACISSGRPISDPLLVASAVLIAQVMLFDDR